MQTYPSLYARLERASRDGQWGSVVRCSATLRELGFVFWGTHVETGNRHGLPFERTVVTWHWHAADGTRGETNTERNAVQALRDRHALTFTTPPPADTPPPTTKTTTTPRRVPTPATPPPAAPAPQIDWNTNNVGGDLRAAIARALDRQKKG